MGRCRHGRLLEAAAVRLKDVPVRWLVAVRSGHAEEGLARVLEHELGERVRRIDLAGLADAALAELILARFPGRWSPGMLRQVVALAAGARMRRWRWPALALDGFLAAMAGEAGAGDRLREAVRLPGIAPLMDLLGQVMWQTMVPVHGDIRPWPPVGMGTRVSPDLDVKLAVMACDRGHKDGSGRSSLPARHITGPPGRAHPGRLGRQFSG